MTRILAIGPSDRVVTGQSVSFHDTVTVLRRKYKVSVVLLNRYANDILNVVELYSQFICNVVNTEVVYLTSSRSWFGIFREFPLVSLSKLLGKQVILHLHGDGLNHAGLLRLAVFSNMVRGCDVIVLSRRMSDNSVLDQAKSISVLPNYSLLGYDGIKEGPFRVLWMSNLMFSKGIIHFLEAIDEFLVIAPDAVVDICGRPLADVHLSEKELSEMLDKHRLLLNTRFGDRVTWHGVVKGEKKQRIFESAHAFVLPSFYEEEALPISLIEAANCQVALVTTDQGYIADIANDNHAMMIEKQSAGDIVKALEYLYVNPGAMQQLRAEAKSFVRRNFSRQRYTEKLFVLIDASREAKS